VSMVAHCFVSSREQRKNISASDQQIACVKNARAEKVLVDVQILKRIFG